MNVEEGATVEFCQEQEKRLRPYADLWKNDLFQHWLSDIKRGLDAIGAASLSTDWESEEGKLRLKTLGLKPPQTQEDELRLYTALRAVVGFWKWNLGIIETQATNYDKTTRKLSELGRQGSVGIHRIAAP